MLAHILNAYVIKLTKNNRRVALTKSEAPTKAEGAICLLCPIYEKPRKPVDNFGRVVACRPQILCD
jgi:hypothetical protein